MVGNDAIKELKAFLDAESEQLVDEILEEDQKHIDYLNRLCTMIPSRNKYKLKKMPKSLGIFFCMD